MELLYSSSLHDQGTKSVSSELQLTFRCFPSSFLESMKHIDTLREFGHIENSMFESSVDADFLNAGSHGAHRLAVIRFKPLLDAAQLETRNSACIRREGLEVTPRRPQPKQRLIRHGSICKYWYIFSSPNLTRLPNYRLETDLESTHRLRFSVKHPVGIPDMTASGRTLAGYSVVE